MLNKLKLFILFVFTIQDVFCMRIIGESLEYRDSRFATIQEANKELFEREPDFFQKFTDEILRWQYIDFEEVARDIIFSDAKMRLEQKLEEDRRKSRVRGIPETVLNPDDYAIALAGEILHFDEVPNYQDDFDWKSPDVIERACFEIIQNEIPKINQHMSFLRLIALDIKEEKPSFRIFYVPCIFLSGTYATNGRSLTDNLLRSMVRFIDTYGFYSTSDQAYSHSERTICLALSQYGDFQLSNFIKPNTKDICIQIRNLSRMCVNCEHFIYGRDIYFINIAGKGCFVTNQYKEDYNTVSSDEEKKEFIKNYHDSLRLNINTIDTYNAGQLNAIFAQVKPKSILELIPHPHHDALILETMSNERLSEVVKIYLP